MAHELTLPKLGLTMECGKILQWHKAEGDWVDKGEITYTMETEKITYEVEADGSGLLHILVEIEVEVPVAALVGYLASTKEEYQELLSKPPEKVLLAAAAEASAPTAAPAAQTAPAPPKGRVKISPAARKMAEEKGLDITTITGTGPGGTIQKEDVLKALEKPKPPAEAPKPPTGAVPLKRLQEKTPLRGVRKIISERMHASLQQ
ncbi:MAG: E3 binding domain-containing protein, partial [Pseudomonadota bacterium]